MIVLMIMVFSGMFNSNIIRYKKYHLKRDGCCVIKNVLSKNDILTIKKMCDESNYEETKEMLLNHPEIKTRIVQTLDKNYVLQDYIWIIKKSAVHTCHRDNNGDFFNKGQRYPSYTMLVYIEDMEKCLGVIPTSHTDINAYNINFANNVENVICNKGDAILFNANLIHVGAINEKDDNLRIQLKVTHKDDIQHIAYYQNFNKVLNEENKLPKPIIQIQKNISCMLPFISDLSQRENINSSRGSVNGSKIGYFQKVFSYLFYGNIDFYDLPNAF
jgi:ectoine hydroxylase-related dioxygenase (phytanoyl-CoA dioxygenase family)